MSNDLESGTVQVGQRFSRRHPAFDLFRVELERVVMHIESVLADWEKLMEEADCMSHADSERHAMHLQARLEALMPLTREIIVALNWTPELHPDFIPMEPHAEAIIGQAETGSRFAMERGQPEGDALTA